MNKENVLPGKIIGLFFGPDHKKWSDLILNALKEEGVNVVVFLTEEKLDNFLWEVNSKSKPYAIIFNDEVMKIDMITSIQEANILTFPISFPVSFSPVVADDIGSEEDILNSFLRNLFCKEEMCSN